MTKPGVNAQNPSDGIFEHNGDITPDSHFQYQLMSCNIGRIMSLRSTFVATALAMTLAALCPAQERFETGWLKGFTKSPTEHIINEPEKPFTVRAVRGVVLDPSGAEMDGVVVEIRDEAHRVFRAFPRTNRTSSIARNPIPCATSSTSEQPAYEPWQRWRSFVPAASTGGDTCCATL